MPRNPRSRSPARHELHDRRREDRDTRRSFVRGSPDDCSERHKAKKYERRRYDDSKGDYKRLSTEEYERDRRKGKGNARDEDRMNEHEKIRERERSPYRDRGGIASPKSSLAVREDTSRRDTGEHRNPSARSSARPRTRSPAHSRPGGSIRSKSPTSEKERSKGTPNFNPSGLLAAETNTVRLADGTASVLKYNEPPEARKPTTGWRLYVFKGTEQTDLLHISRQSCYLFGRDKAVVDAFLEHPSCSKQHAVIQHRQVQKNNEYGSVKTMIKPFIIDLESTNSTFVNDEAIPTARYYELQTGDVIKFGLSTREYVLLHDEAS